MASSAIPMRRALNHGISGLISSALLMGMLAGCSEPQKLQPLETLSSNPGMTPSNSSTDLPDIDADPKGSVSAPFAAGSDGFLAESQPVPTMWPKNQLTPRPEITVDPNTGMIQENPLMRWDEWPEHAHLQAAIYKAQSSALMNEMYGDAMKVVAYDAALAVAISHVGLVDLYGPRTGNEADYYDAIRPYITDALWEGLEERIAQGVSGESFEIGSFAPQTDRNGVWAVVNGVPYTSTGVASLEIVGIPRLVMQGSLIGVSFEIVVTGHALPASIQYDSVYTAVMEFDGTQWLMNGWNNLVTSDIRILDSIKPSQ